MSVKTYDPSKVLVIVNGNIMSGFADGTFVVVEREVEAFAKVVGADGEVTRTKSANKSGSMTITLKQTSASNLVLSALANLDEASSAGVVPVILKEASSVAFATEGWVQKQPPMEYGNEAGDREWIIDLASIEMLHSGN